MKKFFIVFLVSISGILSPQNQYNAQWILGYDIDPSSNAEVIKLDFREDSLQIAKINTMDKFGMGAANTSMCDENGNLLFYSNGCNLVNSYGELIENGDDISPGIVSEYYCPDGMPIVDGILSLKQPCSKNLFHIVNYDLHSGVFSDTIGSTLAPLTLYHHIVDMDANDGKGKIVLKNEVIIRDTFSRGNIKAVLHRNGLDWWIIVPKSHSNCYYVMLLTQDGLGIPDLKCEGHVWNNSDGGASCFSPDTKYYARFNFQNGLNIMNFDNSTGNFSNPINILFPNDTFPKNSGVSFSENSRFLYASAKKKLYQFDMDTGSIEASRVLVAEWDGFKNPTPIIFHKSQLAPDGKIYIGSTSSHLNLSVIESPNKKGLACNVRQHAILLPSWNYISMPGMPYFPGKFNTQLCDSISQVTSLDRFKINAYPNPTSGVFNIAIEKWSPNISVRLFSIEGKQVRNYTIIKNQVDISNLRNGFYFYKLYDSNGILGKGKILKIE